MKHLRDFFDWLWHSPYAAAGLACWILVTSVLAIYDDYSTARAQQAPTPGVGYLHFDWPAPAYRPVGQNVPLDFFYPVTDTAGLAPAVFQLVDAHGMNHGAIPLNGLHAAGADRIDGQYPIIVISHGAGAHGIGYYELARDLAAHGNIVVAVTHLRDSLIEKSVVPAIPPDPWATIGSNRWYDMNLAATVANLIFGTLGGNTNGQYVAMGHSFGGVTAMLMPTGTDALHQPDTRFNAVVAIDPALFLAGLAGYPGMDSTGQVVPGSHLDGLLASLHVPLLVIGGGSDQIVWPAIIDEVVQETDGTPWRERFDVAGSGHTATSSVWALLPGLMASTAPQALKDHVAGTAAGACPDLTDSCVAVQHELQLDVILDFLDRALT